MTHGQTELTSHIIKYDYFGRISNKRVDDSGFLYHLHR
jgi:hypothetical protein